MLSSITTGPPVSWLRKGGLPFIPSVRWVTVILHSMSRAFAPGGGTMYISTSSIDCSHSYTVWPLCSNFCRFSNLPIFPIAAPAIGTVGRTSFRVRPNNQTRILSSKVHVPPESRIRAHKTRLSKSL
jgi:hypothetical protein